MKKLKSYIITSVISLLCIFFIIWSKGIFNKTETKDVMLILTDAFFAVGAVVAGFGLLVVASNGGTFDMMVYGCSKFINKFRKDLSKEKHKSFYEYRLSKQEHKNSYGFLLIVGVSLILISMIFLYGYYEF